MIQPAFTPFRQLVLFVCMGFTSGIPFLMTLSTLSAWLTETGSSPSVVGFFALATCPYMFKFLLGPFVSQFYVPFLTKRLGSLRSCALLSQCGLIVSLIGLGLTDPTRSLWTTAFMTFWVCTCATLQDLSLETYRIETTSLNARGASASAVSFGFRLGLMASGAGALYLASFLSWAIVYGVTATFISLGMIAVLLSPPLTPCAIHAPALSPWRLRTWISSFQSLCQGMPFGLIVLFIAFYKLADTTISVMNIPFLLSLGYSKIEIAQIAKFFGIGAMIVGGFVGGGLLTWIGLWGSLLVAALLQEASCLLLMLQAFKGYHLPLLTFVVGIENFATGLGTTAFIGYISSLCRMPHTASHYALLISIGSFSRLLWSVSAGMVADSLSWSSFFILTGGASFPVLFLLFQYRSVFQKLWSGTTETVFEAPALESKGLL
jgi:PAT family beta-lactamase induction signal transducer AmpG